MDQAIDNFVDEISGDIKESDINEMEILNEENCDDEGISQDIYLKSMNLYVAQKDEIGYENNENTSDFEE